MESECVKISSVTYANKAKDALKKSGIHSKIKKIITEESACEYIFEFDKKSADKAILILEKSGISFEGCVKY